MATRSRLITHDDLRTLEALVAGASARRTLDADGFQKLDEELAEVEPVAADEVGDDVVTMGSTVDVTDLDSGERIGLSVVFPRQANADSHRISVLAPLGLAVLGRQKGDVVEYEVPGGRKRLRVEVVSPAPLPGASSD